MALYPRAHATEVQDLPAGLAALAISYVDPKGCWNRWGHADDRQYLTKKGVQIGVIWPMVERIEGK